MAAAAEQSVEQFKGQARLSRFTANLAVCAFANSVAVSVDVAAPTQFLVPNTPDLNLSPGAVHFTPQGSGQVVRPAEVTNVPKDEILIIRFNEVLPLGEGTLVIALQGTLNDKMMGFYTRVDIHLLRVQSCLGQDCWPLKRLWIRSVLGRCQ